MYPTNPSKSEFGLAEAIVRDSYDIGAVDVVGSGPKLPPPVSMNNLLSVFKGPVLICQGALDPLNNSTRRSELFSAIRSGVTVDLLQLGHCPMDEDASEVGKSIEKWMECL